LLCLATFRHNLTVDAQTAAHRVVAAGSGDGVIAATAADRVVEPIFVSRGRKVMFLGPNGAGKSTTVRMLTTLMTIPSGSALPGLDLHLHLTGARKDPGMLTELFRNM
jgi:ABC-type Na+ transport system ATPase subunit NatA